MHELVHVDVFIFLQISSVQSLDNCLLALIKSSYTVNRSTFAPQQYADCQLPQAVCKDKRPLAQGSWLYILCRAQLCIPSCWDAAKLLKSNDPQ